MLSEFLLNECMKDKLMENEWMNEYSLISNLNIHENFHQLCLDFRTLNHTIIYLAICNGLNKSFSTKPLFSGDCQMNMIKQLSKTHVYIFFFWNWGWDNVTTVLKKKIFYWRHWSDIALVILLDEHLYQIFKKFFFSFLLTNF